MAKTLTCLALGAVLATALWRLPATAQTQYGLDSATAALGRGELITHFDDAEGRPTTLTVIDPHARVVAVYHLQRDNGQIQLKSVRNIRWDLAMDSHNSNDPLPAEIRKMVERQQ